MAVKEITDRITDFEFIMLTAKMDPQLPVVEKVGNIEVHRLGKGNKWDKIRLIFNGWRYAKKLGNFSAIWSIMASYGGFAALGFKRKNPNTPFLLTLQEGDSKWDIYKHVWWCWPYFKQIFTKADYAHAISNYLAGWAKSMGAKSEITVVPNGVDLGKFQQPISPVIPTQGIYPHSSVIPAQAGIQYKEEIKTKLGISGPAKFVITASRLVKKNGVGDLIKAMKYLDTNIYLLIAGTGWLEHELKELTDSLGLKSRVFFLGNVSHADLPKYLWGSDVFCRPSLSEGLGNVFIEAMAAGLPILGTKVGGILDFLKEGETGLFCRVGDPRDIAEKIKRALEEPQLSVKLRENGLKLSEKYNWNSIAESMKNILDSLCVF